MIRLVAQTVLWLSVTAVVVVAGGHTVYYLLYWEWNRASIAGVGFVAGLLIAVTFLLLGRLQRLERRLTLLLAEAEAEAGQAAPRVGALASDAEPRPDFAWLSRPPLVLAGLLVVMPRPVPDEGVFIPVFLAAGLVVSVLAGVVERIAAFVQGRPANAPALRQVLRERPRRSLVWFPVLALLLVGLAVGALYLGSHYWSRPIGSGVTTMAVHVDSRGGPPRAASEVVEAVGRFCTMDTGIEVDFAGVSSTTDGTTLLRVEPLLDDDAQRRYIGCLEDAQLEWHRLTVTSTALDPS